MDIIIIRVSIITSNHITLDVKSLTHYLIKVRKKAKIRNLYNQVPHLTQDTIWESDKSIRKHYKQKSQAFSPFQAGDHKASVNRQDSMTDTKHK